MLVIDNYEEENLRIPSFLTFLLLCCTSHPRVALLAYTLPLASPRHLPLFWLSSLTVISPSPFLNPRKLAQITPSNFYFLDSLLSSSWLMEGCWKGMNVFCFAAHRNGRGVLIPPRYPTFPPFSLSPFRDPLKATACFATGVSRKVISSRFIIVGLWGSVCLGHFRAGESSVLLESRSVELLNLRCMNW